MRCVLAEDSGAVRILTINRPEARNALNSELFETLYVAMSNTHGLGERYAAVAQRNRQQIGRSQVGDDQPIP